MYIYIYIYKNIFIYLLICWSWIILTWLSNFVAPCGFNPSGAKLRSDEEDRWAASGALGRAVDFPKNLWDLWPLTHQSMEIQATNTNRQDWTAPLCTLLPTSIRFTLHCPAASYCTMSSLLIDWSENASRRPKFTLVPSLLVTIDATAVYFRRGCDFDQHARQNNLPDARGVTGEAYRIQGFAYRGNMEDLLISHSIWYSLTHQWLFCQQRYEIGQIGWSLNPFPLI